MKEFIYGYYRSPNYIIYHIIISIGVVIGVMKFNKLNRSSRIFLLLLLLTPMVELSAFYCKINFKTNNLVYNPFTILQFTLIAIGFYVDCRLRVILFLLLSFLIFSVLDGLYFEPFLTKFNSNTLLLECLFNITIYFIYLSTYFIKSDNDSLTSYPLFWIGIGFMLFSIASLIAFGIPMMTKISATWRSISLTTLRTSNYLLYLSFIPAFLSPQKSLNDPTPG